MNLQPSTASQEHNALHEVITFYSYKGGTGRTMALANVACLLASGRTDGKRILMVDWDLEAPGLHHYFKAPDAEPPSSTVGVIELFTRLSEASESMPTPDNQDDDEAAESLLSTLTIGEFFHPTSVPNLDLMPAGCIDETYRSRLSAIEWQRLYVRVPAIFRVFARTLAEQFAAVLVDSRTGLTDIGSVCTALLPDKLVVVFTPNQQSLSGIEKLVSEIVAYRQESKDLRPLLVYPLASRIDAERDELRQLWRHGDLARGIEGYQKQLERALQLAYGLPACDLSHYCDEVLVKHSPDYSYGEPIAALESTSSDRYSFVRAYQVLVDWLAASALPWETLELALKRSRLETLSRQEAELRERADPDERSLLSSLQEELLGLLNEIRGPQHCDAVEAARRLIQTSLASTEGAAKADELLQRLAKELPELREPVRWRALSTVLDGAGRLRFDNRVATADLLVQSIGLAFSPSAGPPGKDALTMLTEISEDLAGNKWLVEARALKEQILTTQLRSIGEEHPGTLATMSGLATTLWSQGDLSGARALEEQVLAVRRRLRGLTSDELRTAYLRRVLNQLRGLDLGGIDPAAATDAQALNIDQVYTGLLTTAASQIPEGMDHPELKVTRRRSADGSAEGDNAPLSVVAALDRHKRLVLLGDPGSGKSTFLEYVALCMAGEGLEDPGLPKLTDLTAPLPGDDGEPGKETQPWSHGPLLPVRIVLRDFAATGLPADPNATATAEHLRQHWEQKLIDAALSEAARDLDAELKNSGGIVLLDGLDEVPDAERRREQIKEAISDFVKTYDRCRFLVTSRPYAYQDRSWRLPDFETVTIAPFDDGQIRQFIRRWYAQVAERGKVSRENAEGRAELLEQVAIGNPRLHELAERPLLLTLIASLHAWRQGSLPDQRAQLYEQATDLLLNRWEQRRAVRGSDGQFRVVQQSLVEYLKLGPAGSEHPLRTALNKLAFEAHSRQPERKGTADIPSKDLSHALMQLATDHGRSEINAAQLLRFLRDRTGIIVARSEDVFSFPHRSFQEYLAASFLVENEHPEHIEFPDNVARLVRKDSDRWREVALLAAAKSTFGGSQNDLWALVDELTSQSGETERPATEVDAAWSARIAAEALIESVSFPAALAPRKEAIAARLKSSLVSVLRSDLPALERARPGANLAQLGDPREHLLDPLATEFCYIPPGPFYMGAPDEDTDAYDDERPAGLYRFLGVDGKESPLGYWMSRYPVTHAQFAAFVQAGGYSDGGYWHAAVAQSRRWRSEAGFKSEYDVEPRRQPIDYPFSAAKANAPVVSVSWYEAAAYASWLDEQLRNQRLIPDGYRVQLPNEPEWEKASRGGEEMLESPVVGSARRLQEGPLVLRANPLPRRTFPWGEEPPDGGRTNGADAGIGDVSAAGCFPDGASPYGCEDMSGNVWEWMRSLGAEAYPYPSQPEKRGKREDLTLEGPRVMRGGSFINDRQDLRCAYRFMYDWVYRYRGYGFRLVVSPFL